MKSIATTFLEGFGVSPEYRPVGLESILISMLIVAAKQGSLDAMIEQIESTSDYEFTGSLEAIKQVAVTEFIPYLHKNPETIMLLLSLQADLLEIDRYAIIDTPEDFIKTYPYVTRRELLKYIEVFNRLDCGVKLYAQQGSGIDKVGIIKYKDRDDLIDIIQLLDLPSYTRDRLI